MTFPGFPEPRENWSKLPHCLIEALRLFSSISELKCVLYILRHTWGFQEFDTAKKITVDEFMHGRKRRDGTRLDSGTGLSKPSVIDGLRRAEEHGFIEVEIDDRDKGRVKKFYILRMQGSNSLTSEVNDLDNSSQGSGHRTEKDTLESNLGEIWTACLQELEMQMTHAIFDRHYKGSRLLSCNGTAVIACRDPEWVTAYHTTMVQRTLTGVTGEACAVRFEEG